MKYQERLNEHLAKYKRDVLALSLPGTWINPRTKQPTPYDHILPDDNRRLNICTPFRDRFWRQFNEWAATEPHHVVKLHKYFSHLNSSQALCFNLFYPHNSDHRWCLSFISRVLELHGERPKRQSFEWIEDPQEETNYDYFIHLDSGRKLFFEVKLSESGFGTATNDERHLGKLKEIYEPKLSSLVDRKWLEPSAFCSRYQLLRNMCHLGSGNNLLFLVVPKANDSLKPALAELPEITGGALKERVKVLFLEDFISAVNGLLATIPGPLQEHYREVGRKYVVN